MSAKHPVYCIKYNFCCSQSTQR